MFKNLEYHYSQDKWKEHARKKDWHSGKKERVNSAKLNFKWYVWIKHTSILCTYKHTKVTIHSTMKKKMLYTVTVLKNVILILVHVYMYCTIPAIQGNTTIVVPSSTDYFVVVVKIATLPVESVLQYVIKLFFTVHIKAFTCLTFYLTFLRQLLKLQPLSTLTMNPCSLFACLDLTRFKWEGYQKQQWITIMETVLMHCWQLVSTLLLLNKFRLHCYYKNKIKNVAVGVGGLILWIGFCTTHHNWTWNLITN